MPTTPLFDPDAFFEGRDADLLAPALIAWVAGAAGVATGVPETLAARPAVSAGVVAAAVAVGAAVGGGVTWLVVAGAIHAVSALYRGGGGFRRTLAFAGWGFLPGVFAGAIAVAATFAGGGAVAAWIGVAASVAGTVWEWYVWAYAAVHARALDRAAGFATAAVPAVGMILFAVAPVVA